MDAREYVLPPLPGPVEAISLDDRWWLVCARLEKAVGYPAYGVDSVAP